MGSFRDQMQVIVWFQTQASVLPLFDNHWYPLYCRYDRISLWVLKMVSAISSRWRETSFCDSSLSPRQNVFSELIPLHAHRWVSFSPNLPHLPVLELRFHTRIMVWEDSLYQSSKLQCSISPSHLNSLLSALMKTPMHCSLSLTVLHVLCHSNWIHLLTGSKELFASSYSPELQISILEIFKYIISYFSF